MPRIAIVGSFSTGKTTLAEAVAEPLIWPPVLSDNPGGSDPDAMDQVKGGVPPDALTCCE